MICRSSQPCHTLTPPYLNPHPSRTLTGHVSTGHRCLSLQQQESPLNRLGKLLLDDVDSEEAFARSVSAPKSHVLLHPLPTRADDSMRPDGLHRASQRLQAEEAAEKAEKAQEIVETLLDVYDARFQSLGDQISQVSSGAMEFDL